MAGTLWRKRKVYAWQESCGGSATRAHVVPPWQLLRGGCSQLQERESPGGQKWGKVVFSQAGSYIDLGDGRRDQIEFKNGLYVLKLWVPRDQKMDFHGQA